MADLDFIPEDDKGLNGFLDKIEGEGGDALAEKVTTWEKSIRLYKSGQPEAPKEGTRDYAQFRNNIIRPAADRKGSTLVENKPEIEILPLTNGYTKCTDALTRIIRADWEPIGMQAALDDIGNFLQILNCYFIELGWDPNANYGMGSIVASPVDPRQTLVDPSMIRSRDLSRTAQYMRVRTVVPLYTVAELYPGITKDLKPCNKILATEADQQRPTGLVGALGRATQRWAGKPIHRDPPIERVQLDTYWFRDPRTERTRASTLRETGGEPIYPGGRCVVRANDDLICLKDGFSEGALREETQNPYYDGEWPYEMIDNVPDIDQAWGRDELCAMRWIQNTFDKIGNTTVQTMLDNAKPFILAPKNAMDIATVNTLQELNHIVLQYTAGRGDVTRQPSPIPTGVYFQLMQMCQAMIDLSMGLSDSGPPKGRVEARSNDMLEGLQTMGQVLIRGQARRLEQMLERIGTKWISRIFQFMTMDRLMWYVGPKETEKYAFERAKLTDEILDVALQRVQQQHTKQQEQEAGEVPEVVIPNTQPTPPPKFLDNNQNLAAIKGAYRGFRFHVKPLSSLSNTRRAQAAELASLNAQALVPGHMVLEKLGYNNAKDLTVEAVEEARERAALGVPALMQPPGGKKGKKK